MIGFGVGYYRGLYKGEEKVIQTMIERPELFSMILTEEARNED